jgi:cell division protein FtsQ
MRDAEVKRKLPDTIIIEVDVRTPVAVVKQNGMFIMLDREGYVLEKRKKLPHYTFFDGITVSEATLGQVVKVKEEDKYQQYMALIDEMNAADLFFRKLMIKDKEVRLYARLNLYCTGTKKNLVQGMRDGNLKAVLYNLSKKDIEKGVVSVGDNNYYSFKKSVK